MNERTRFEQEIKLLTLSEVPPADAARVAKVQEDCRSKWLEEVKKYPFLVGQAINSAWENHHEDAVMLAIFIGIRDKARLARIHFFSSLGSKYGFCEPKSKEALFDYKASQSSVNRLLLQPTPRRVQFDPVPCAKEKRKTTAEKDNPSVDITGRYYSRSPLINRGGLHQQTYLINQAGLHFECVNSDIYINTVAKTKPREYRVYREIHGDLLPDRTFLWFYRTRPTNYGMLREDRGHLFIKHDPTGSEIELIPTEKRPTLMGPGTKIKTKYLDLDLFNRVELFPLTPIMKNWIRKSLDVNKLDKIFQKYWDKANKSGWDELVRLFLEGFKIYENEDLPMVRLYSRRILTIQKWTPNRGYTLSHLDWIQRMVNANQQTSAGLFNKYLGLTLPSKDRLGEHVYKFSIDVYGGASLLGGGYGGQVQVEKTTGRTWKKLYNIRLFGIAITKTLIDVGHKEWAGIAYPQVEWYENDIPGRIALARLEGGLAMGLVSGELGFMHVNGNGSLPIMDVIFQDAKLGFPNIKEIRDTLKSKKSKLDKVIDFVDIEAQELGGYISFSKADPQEKADFSKKWNDDVSASRGVSSTVHFCLDDSSLTDAARQSLRVMCARELASFMEPETRLLIVGHADTLAQHKKDHNKNLSLARAKNTLDAIKAILGNKFMIKEDEKHIGISGWGHFFAYVKYLGRTVASPKDRRVAIFLNSELVLTLNG